MPLLLLPLISPTAPDPKYLSKNPGYEVSYLIFDVESIFRSFRTIKLRKTIKNNVFMLFIPKYKSKRGELVINKFNAYYNIIILRL